jgi:hypothetical protein
MTTLTSTASRTDPTFSVRSRLATVRDAVIIGLCIILATGFIIDVAAGGRAVQPAAVHASLST